MSNNPLIWTDGAKGAGIGAGVGSVVPGVGTLIGGVVGGVVGGLYGAYEQTQNSQGGDSLQSPDSLSSTPSRAAVNTTTLQSQLNKESAARAYGTTLTSGAGLLDQPTTTSQVLLGS